MLGEPQEKCLVLMLIGNLGSQRHQRVIEPHPRSRGYVREPALKSFRPDGFFGTIVGGLHLAQEPQNLADILLLRGDQRPAAHLKASHGPLHFGPKIADSASRPLRGWLSRALGM